MFNTDTLTVKYAIYGKQIKRHVTDLSRTGRQRIYGAMDLSGAANRLVCRMPDPIDFFCGVI